MFNNHYKRYVRNFYSMINRQTVQKYVNLISNILIIWIEFAHYLVFQTLLEDKNRNLPEKVAFVTVICNKIKGITVILDFNGFVAD